MPPKPSATHYRNNFKVMRRHNVKGITLSRPKRCDYALFWQNTTAGYYGSPGKGEELVGCVQAMAIKAATVKW